MDSVLQALGFQPVYLVDGIIHNGAPARPKLHLKGHFIASAEVWEAVVRSERLALVLERYLALRAATTGRRHQDPGDLRAMSDEVAGAMRQVLKDGLAATNLVSSDRAMLYLTVGSPNQDYRSLMLDGEAMIVVSGPPALVGFFDFVVIAGQCRWVETVEELQALLPEPSNLKRLLARWIKTLL